MISKRLFALFFILPIILKSQNTGIHFEDGLSWKQVKAKAEKENKYIFVDCFTTWCGPCKLMAKEVYPDEKIAAYFNEHFISVKSQMDKTADDNDDVRHWYKDADAIQKEYGVAGYPTYFFFSPGGELIYRDIGYKAADDFLAIAQIAIAPGTSLKYGRYYSMMRESQNGKSDYDVMPALIDTSNQLGQRNVADSISREYVQHLKKLNKEYWYNRETLKFLGAYMNSSKSIFFSVFYLHDERVDSAVGSPGYAQFVIDGIINNEVVIPFAKLHTGMGCVGCPEDSVVVEPEWSKLIQKLQNDYDSSRAIRLVTIARIQWYADHKDWGSCAKWLTIAIKNGYYDRYGDLGTDMFCNGMCWDPIFERSVDKDQIDEAIRCMKRVVQRIQERGDAPFIFLDTYANLLYKADKKEEAIHWEQRALQSEIDWKQPKGYIDEFTETLGKMKNGEPTWPHYQK